MPLYIPDELAPYLKVRLLGTIFSAVAYGIVIVLFANCFQLLQKKQGTYSIHMRIVLLIYVIVMLLLSTGALIQLICQFVEFISLRNILPSYLAHLSIATPPVIWGADGFMVRFIICCQEQRFTIQFYRYGDVLSCIRMCQNASGS